jgi:hypothetical protein
MGHDYIGGGRDEAGRSWIGESGTWRYNDPVTTLSENEERLVEALRSLPPDAADQVIIWTTRLCDLADGRRVDWSDTWTEEDLEDARRASLSGFDEREREDD